MYQAGTSTVIYLPLSLQNVAFNACRPNKFSGRFSGLESHQPGPRDHLNAAPSAREPTLGIGFCTEKRKGRPATGRPFLGRQLQQRQSYWNSLVKEYVRYPAVSSSLIVHCKHPKINSLERYPHDNSTKMTSRRSRIPHSANGGFKLGKWVLRF